MDTNENIKVSARPAVSRRADLDMIRVLAFSLVIIYHFMIETETHGVFSFTEHGIFYMNANVHIASLGVAMFFMLSGVGLMLGTKRKFNLKQYWKRRFVKILLPFYVTYLGALVLLCIMRHPLPFDGKTPFWTVIFTLTGTDEYASLWGISDFSLGIGEWFLGALMLMYAVFPLLRVLMKKFRFCFPVLSAAVYLVLLAFYSFRVPAINNAAIKLFDFIFGMLLAQWLLFPEGLSDSALSGFAKRKRAARSHLSGTVGAVFMLFLVFCPLSLPVPDEIKATAGAAALMLFFTGFEDVWRRMKRLNRVMHAVSGITFEIYLVHHLIIYWFSGVFEDSVLPVSRMLLLLIGVLAVMVFAAVMLKGAVKGVTKLLKL